MKNFKPMLAPNKLLSFKRKPKTVYIGDIKLPLLASKKLDGVRCELLKGRMLSRSLKEIPNMQVREKFLPLITYSGAINAIMDGEIYNHGIPFQLILSCVMTEDYTTKSSIKRWADLCEKHNIDVSREEVFQGLKFNCFDMITNDDLSVAFISRYDNSKVFCAMFPDLTITIEQVMVYDVATIKKLYEQALEDGYEGLILRSSNGRYKCNRGTIKEALIFKLKPYETFDGVIKAITQGTMVDPKAPKTINELGRSVTSKKKADRILVDRVRDFVVDYEGVEVAVSTSSMSHKEREEYWKIKDELIGQWIEYKGMLIGAVNVPRHPVFIRFREPKE